MSRMTSAPWPPVATLTRCDEILGPVVDRDVGAELQAGRALRLAAGGGDHRARRRPWRAGWRWCRCPTCRHGRARVSPAASRPRSKRFGQTVKKVSGIAAASTMREAGGHRQGVGLVHLAIFGIAAAGHEGGDLVAEREAARAGTERDDLAGDLEARDVRRRPAGGGYWPFRCSTSGRLTPAAWTRTRISRSPGTGSGRSSGTSASGPPGVGTAMAVILSGSGFMAPPWRARPGLRRSAGADNRRALR